MSDSVPSLPPRARPLRVPVTAVPRVSVVDVPDSGTVDLEKEGLETSAEVPLEAAAEPAVDVDVDVDEVASGDRPTADEPEAAQAAPENDEAPAESAAADGVEGDHEILEEELDDDVLVEAEAEAAPPAPPAPPPEAKPPAPPPEAKPPAPPAEAKPPAPPAGAKAKGEPKVPTPKKRKRPWFEDFFSDDYLRTVRTPTAKEVAKECDFIVEVLGLEPGNTVLDVGCGLGLHAVELTARGFLVVGLDLSLPMLSRASDEAQDRGLKINFLHGDMREMTFDGAFDAVLSWGTSFGYFDDEANRRVVQRLRSALKPGGKLLLDVVNRDYVQRFQPNLVWFEGDGCICMEETIVNSLTSRLEVKRNVILDDGKQRDKHYSIRLYSLHELGPVLHRAGFRVISVSGMLATPGVFFGADSPRMTVLAERRPEENGSQPPPPPA